MEQQLGWWYQLLLLLLLRAQQRGEKQKWLSFFPLLMQLLVLLLLLQVLLLLLLFVSPLPYVLTDVIVQPLASQLQNSGDVPVWAHPEGSARGPSISPIYRTAPQAALVDPALHRLLALLDGLRIGRVRERELAARLLGEFLRGNDGPA